MSSTITAKLHGKIRTFKYGEILKVAGFSQSGKKYLRALEGEMPGLRRLVEGGDCVAVVYGAVRHEPGHFLVRLQPASSLLDLEQECYQLGILYLRIRRTGTMIDNFQKRILEI